jgi:hypothetical protein
MAEHGVRQFLDLGSGLPGAGNTPQVAQRVAPGAKIVCVDIDPVVVAHGELILQDSPDAVIMRRDLRDVDDVLNDRRTRELLDFSQPVGILMCAVNHFIGAESDLFSVIARYRDATIPGSFLAISHLTSDERTQVGDVVERYRATPVEIHPRSKDEIGAMFAGYRLLDPGVVATWAWRPEIQPDTTAEPALYAAVGERA